MYVPVFNRLEDRDEIRRMVCDVGTAELITAAPAGPAGPAGPFPMATRLPLVWDEEHDRVVFHVARANPHWRAIEAAGGPVAALAVVTGPEVYISPAWYAAKAEHGRVVPTWNYSAVHFRGHVSVRHDAGWLRDAVELLTDLHEARRAEAGAEPWAVADAPPEYIAKNLRAIVGVELRIEELEAKAKLSQNRSEADVAGVVAGLRAEGAARERAVADQMET